MCPNITKIFSIHPDVIISPEYEGSEATIRHDDSFIALRSSAQSAFACSLFACTFHHAMRNITYFLY